MSYTAAVRCRLCARRRRAAAGVSHGPRSQYRRDREPSQLLQGWRRPPLPQPPSYLGRLTTPCKFSQLHNFSGLCFLLSFLANITFRTLHFSQPACYAHPCMPVFPVVLSDFPTLISSLLRLSTHHLALAASASQPLQSGTLSIHLSVPVPVLIPFVVTSRPTTASRPSNPLNPSLLVLRFDFADHCAHL